MKYISLLLICLSGVASAATVPVTWTNPTQYVDDSAISATDITQTRIEYGTCAGVAFNVKAGEHKIAGSVTTAAIVLAPGTWCLRAYTTASEVESVTASNVIQKIVPQPAPKPPVMATVSTVAMNVRPNWDTLTFEVRRVVGSVALGVPCDPKRGIAGGYYAIQSSAVIWAVNAKPERVVAKCAG